jgi:NAD(P)-dependent dehydrogenase (short-subunit alcohol dehydrogenase family)
MSNLSESSPTVLITGCSRGIGLGLVKQFLSIENVRVVATCRNPDGATELQQLQNDYSSRLAVLPLDVNIKESFDGLNEVLNAINIQKIDILINNAGTIRYIQIYHFKR